MKEEGQSTETQIALFGALSQSHTSSLEMDLKIPLLPDNPSSLLMGPDRLLLEVGKYYIHKA